MSVAGCGALKAPPRSIESIEGASVSHSQLRARVVHFVGYAERLVAEAGEEIVRRTDDPEARRNSLLWRIYACSELQSAGMRADPVVGLIDTWHVSAQMRQLFERGNGDELLGEFQVLAAETARRIEREVAELAASTAPPEAVEAVRAGIEEYVARHPAESLHLALWGQPAEGYMKLLDAKSAGAFGSVATMEDSISHLTLALPEMVKISADLARWEAQLVVHDLLGSRTVAEVLAELRDVSRLAREVDELAATERLAATHDLVAAVNEQRAALLEALDAQRQLIQDLVRTERATALGEIDRQRLETVAQLQEEREVVVEALERTIAGALETVPDRIQEGVDAFWLRALQVGGPAAALAGIAILLAGRYLIDRARRDTAA